MEKFKLENNNLGAFCDANYVGHTARHLHQRVRGHRYSANGKHPFTKHGLDKNNPLPTFLKF